MSVTKEIQAQKYHIISGMVSDSTGIPLEGVNIGIKNEEYNIRTNADGKFKIKLQEGIYTVIFTRPGYYSYSLVIALYKSEIKNVILFPQENYLKEFEKKVGRDPGPRLMQYAIQKRNYWLNHLSSFTCKVYIRASDETEKKRKHDKDIPDSLIQFLMDSVPPNINLAEFLYLRHVQNPGNIKEIKEGGRIVGKTTHLYYLSGVEGDFNFYKSYIFIQALSENTFVSPLSSLAPASYKFDLKETYYHNGRKIYKIKVSPRIFGNALFSGEIHIVDSTWNIYRTDLSIASSKLNKYNSFVIKQWYNISAEYSTLKKQEFFYTYRKKNDITRGKTMVYYSDYIYNPVFPKKFFGDELMTAAEDAYEKNERWWDSLRQEPLDMKEWIAIQQADSIRILHEKKEYTDSLDSATNAVTFWKIVWWGQEHVNRKRQEFYRFQSVAEIFLNSFLNGVILGGPRAVLNLSYYRKYPNRRTILFTPNLSYGFKLKDVKGSFTADWLYDPIKRATLSFSTGKQFDLIFPYDAYLNVLKSSNFYEHSFINVDHDIELINGLYISAFAMLAHRESVAGYNFSSIFDSLPGTKGKPVNFDSYNAFTGEARIRYIPHQQYIREPKEKIILGSFWPMFQIKYRKGIPGIANSIVNFDYIEFQIRQKINLKIFGNLEYNFKTGTFLNKSNALLIDYKYHRRGDPYLFTNPLQTYQLLDTSFPTFKWFQEFHVYHRFNGYFTNKIPLFKKLNINEVGGAAFLYAPEVNKTHAEIFIGAERVVKILGRSFRFGIYSAYGLTNGSFHGRGIKFSVEYFDAVKNRWQF